MWTLTDSAPEGLTLFDFPAPAGRVIAGAFDDALETNPVPLFMLSRELNSAREAGPRLTKEDALDQAKRSGVQVTVPDDGISQSALGILIERRKDQAARDLLFSRREGSPAAIGSFAAQLAGALMDPVNAAAGYIPVLSGTRYAAALERAASAGGRMAMRAGVGAAEGVVGASIVEAPISALRRDLQDEYTLYDSLANIAFGTFASAGLRATGGLAVDAWARMRSLRARQIAADTTAAMDLEREMVSDLELGTERGPGIPSAMAASMEARRSTEALLAEVERSRGAARRAEIETFLADQRRAEEDRLIEASESQVRGVMEAENRRIQAENVPAFLRTAEDVIAMRGDKEGENLLPIVRQAIEIAKKPGFQRTAEEKLLLDAIVNGQLRGYLAPRPSEAAMVVSDATHAQALKAAVAQAMEGRQIDVDSVLLQDPVFGPKQMTLAEVVERARINMAAESKVGADRQASVLADDLIKQRTEAPAAKPGGAESPPPRGDRAADAAGAEAKPISAERAEAEALLAETKVSVQQAANDAGVTPPKDDGAALKQSEDYANAWEAIAVCARRLGA